MNIDLSKVTKIEYENYVTILHGDWGPNGQLIGITDDCICGYRDADHFWNCERDDSVLWQVNIKPTIEKEFDSIIRASMWKPTTKDCIVTAIKQTLMALSEMTLAEKADFHELVNKKILGD